MWLTSKVEKKQSVFRSQMLKALLYTSMCMYLSPTWFPKLIITPRSSLLLWLSLANNICAHRTVKNTLFIYNYIPLFVLDKLKTKLRNKALVCVVQQVWPAVPRLWCQMQKCLGMRSNRHARVNVFHTETLFSADLTRNCCQGREQSCQCSSGTRRLDKAVAVLKQNSQSLSTALSSPTSVMTSSPLPGQSTSVHPEQNSRKITPWRT